MKIYVDADACPVKQEVYRVAERYGAPVCLVSNSWMRTPNESWIELVVVEDLFDAADDWIAENIQAEDILVSEDIPLAARCIEKSALALTPRGKIHTEDSIGDRLATRDLMSFLRDLGEVGGGPPPFDPSDRSRFLSKLDQLIQKVRRQRAKREKREQREREQGTPPE